MTNIDTLNQSGYIDIKFPNTSVSFWKDQKFKMSGTTRTKRCIHNCTCGYNQHILNHIVTDELRNILTSIMERPAIQMIQKIITKTGQPEQEVHRDHDLGKNKLLTLVFTLDQTPVSTLFQPGSHNEEHKVIYRNEHFEADRKERRARMTKSPNSAVLFDAFIMHAGAETYGPDYNRVFVSFIDLNLPNEEIEQLNQISFCKKNVKYLPVV